MSDRDKLFVIGRDITEIHRHTTRLGIPWHEVEPVTGADQLRVRPGQKQVVYIWANVGSMHKAVLSVIRTQLSIRRCLGQTLDATGIYEGRLASSPRAVQGVVDYYLNTGHQPVWRVTT